MAGVIPRSVAAPAGAPAADDDMAAAYSATASAWQAGAGPVYDRMAEALVAASPVELRGRLVLDVGAGTGAASRAVAAAGARPIASDLAVGMLVAGAAVCGRPALAADVRALPVGTGSVGAVVAAFSFNHVPDPDRALAEAARVVAPGGAVLASVYALDDHHPVKEAVEEAATALGWRPPAWVARLRADAIPQLATVERARAAVARAGLARADVERVDVAFPDLGPLDLVRWRLGMAQMAPFTATLAPSQRDELTQRALDLLGDAPPLVRRMIVVAARV